MLRGLRDRLLSRLPLLYTIEATLIGLFFIQALRYAAGIFYARIASASLQPALNPTLIDPNMPGLIMPSTISNELQFLVLMMFLPLLGVLAGRLQFLTIIAVLIAASGRYYLSAESDVSTAIWSAVILGGGLLYIVMLIRHRASVFPTAFLLVLGLDQVYRAFGNTLDPSWEVIYANTQLVLSIGVVALAIFTTFAQMGQNAGEEWIRQNRGIMSIWSGIGFGAILFLELSLLALPNAIARRADTTYALAVPIIAVATLLPLIPWIRARARRFISLFDSSVRGWSWMLLAMLLIVVGTRLDGIIAGVALAMAQFCVSMLVWWLFRPQASKERNFTGLWLVFGMLVFGLLTVFDIFTYEYAFVRNFSPEYDALNRIIPPLLRGFRGLGLAVLIMAVFLGALPMVQSRRRIAWAGGTAADSFLGLLMVIVITGLTVFYAQPPIVPGTSNPESIRVGTYNLHAGYNEFYHYDLEALARTIEQSGSNVVLLQEIEAGRMTSFSVDQPLWLARRLKMDVRFFPTNEGLQGLAVLSNIEIVFDDGELLDSIGSQTGLQRVQVRPDAGIITVYNTWLDPLLDTGGNVTVTDLEASQIAQLQQMFGIIRAQHPPDGQLGRTIIGGTFNNLPDSNLIQRLKDSGFIDYFEGGPVDRFATFYRTDAQARLDYLWTTRNLNVTQRGVIDTRASDHRMATIELSLR